MRRRVTVITRFAKRRPAYQSTAAVVARESRPIPRHGGVAVSKLVIETAKKTFETAPKGATRVLANAGSDLWFGVWTSKSSTIRSSQQGPTRPATVTEAPRQPLIRWDILAE